jgi:hypothetical protein
MEITWAEEGGISSAVGAYRRLLKTSRVCWAKGRKDSWAEGKGKDKGTEMLKRKVFFEEWQVAVDLWCMTEGYK